MALQVLVGTASFGYDTGFWIHMISVESLVVAISSLCASYSLITFHITKTTTVNVVQNFQNGFCMSVAMINWNNDHKKRKPAFSGNIT